MGLQAIRTKCRPNIVKGLWNILPIYQVVEEVSGDVYISGRKAKAVERPYILVYDSASLADFHYTIRV